MVPDYQCSWWPDQWFGISLTDCCIAHDLGGSDIGLASCVSHLSHNPFYMILGVVMLIGVTLFRPLYRWWQERKNNK